MNTIKKIVKYGDSIFSFSHQYTDIRLLTGVRMPAYELKNKAGY